MAMTAQALPPFCVRTLGEYDTHVPRQPHGLGSDEWKFAFPVDDPFGLRRAVVPVFRREPEGTLRGAGTAFQVDGWGTYVSAEHVVDFMRGHWVPVTELPDHATTIDPTHASSAVMLLGMGLVYGTVGIPQRAFAPVHRMFSVYDGTQDQSDPFVQSEPPKTAFDVACLTALVADDAPPRSSLPLRSVRWRPTVGEWVLAVGFPTLDFSRVDEAQLRATLREGMAGAYGRIVAVHPHGRSPRTPNPGFEVEADWQGGMSGGPVFNATGEVVGVVSSSVAPTSTEPGIGFATCLAGIPHLRQLLPSLDLPNPGWRRGFGVVHSQTHGWVEFFPEKERAQALAHSLGPEYHVRTGTHRLGTKEFMIDAGAES